MNKFLAGLVAGCVLTTVLISEPRHKIDVVNSADLTVNELENRNGNIIIERVLGVVTDAENGDGCEFSGNYISYRSVPEISNGDVICTYLVYNPDTNYIDDIVARYDYVME